MKSFAVLLVALVILGCSSNSKVLNPLEPQRDGPGIARQNDRTASPQANDPASDCIRTQALYNRKIGSVMELISRIQAIENKTEQDIAAEQELQRRLEVLVEEANQAICEACPGSC